MEAPRDTVESSLSSSRKRRKKSSSKIVQNVKILDDDDDDNNNNNNDYGQGKRRQQTRGGADDDDNDEIVRFVTQQKRARGGAEADDEADDENDIVLGEEGPVIVGERSLLQQRRDTVPTSVPQGTWVSVNDNDDNTTAAAEVSSRRRRHDSDNEDEGDASSTRRASNNRKAESPPPARQRRHNSDNDESPPRRPTTATTTMAEAALESRNVGDLSPPRRSHTVVDDDDDGDLDVPRQRTSVNNGDDNDDDGDLDVPRRGASATSAGAGSSSSGIVDATKLAMASDGDVALAVMKAREVKARMSSGVAAGLQSAAELRADAERLRKEEAERFAQLDASQLGRNTAAVVRDRKGRRLTDAEIAASRAPRADADADVNMEWGKGLVQRAEQREARAALLEARDAPFARRAEDNDDRLKAEQRWGDPMFGYSATTTSASSASKAGSSTAPVYRGPAPTNRFNIRPGPQWDGVDRSNGSLCFYFFDLFSQIGFNTIIAITICLGFE